MPITKTVYKDRYPELVDFEIIEDSGSSIDLTMNAGAATLIISSTSFFKEFIETDSPVFLKKDKYSMRVGRTSAVTDPANPPSVTIIF